MILAAELYIDRGIWKSDHAYVIAENDPLSISLGAEHAGETATIKSAHHVDSYRLDEHGAVEVNKKFIEEGPLLISVNRYIDGRCVRAWKIDPLSLKINEETVEATPWVVSVEDRLTDLENAVLGYSSPVFE